jgi:hypothetical protein
MFCTTFLGLGSWHAPQEPQLEGQQWRHSARGNLHMEVVQHAGVIDRSSVSTAAWIQALRMEEEGGISGRKVRGSKLSDARVVVSMGSMRCAALQAHRRCRVRLWLCGTSSNRAIIICDMVWRSVQQSVCAGRDRLRCCCSVRGATASRPCGRVHPTHVRLMSRQRIL